jgi:hypothetical protein
VQYVGALVRADLAGEHHQLVGAIRRRRIAVDRHGVGHQLGAHGGHTPADAVERFPRQARHEVGAPQHRRHQPREAIGERHKRSAVDARHGDEATPPGERDQCPLAHERPLFG